MFYVTSRHFAQSTASIGKVRRRQGRFSDRPHGGTAWNRVLREVRVFGSSLPTSQSRCSRRPRWPPWPCLPRTWSSRRRRWRGRRRESCFMWWWWPPTSGGCNRRRGWRSASGSCRRTCCCTATTWRTASGRCSPLHLKSYLYCYLRQINADINTGRSVTSAYTQRDTCTRTHNTRWGCVRVSLGRCGVVVGDGVSTNVLCTTATVVNTKVRGIVLKVLRALTQRHVHTHT